jgi:hypothetical protein
MWVVFRHFSAGAEENYEEPQNTTCFGRLEQESRPRYYAIFSLSEDESRITFGNVTVNREPG